MANSNGKIIGFRPTPNQAHELKNICSELGVKKSTLIRFLLDNFIEQYERKKLG